MKKLLLTTALMAFSSPAFAGEGHVSEKAKNQTGEILYWVAPMDPEFRRDEPGKSPMGMDLIPVYEQDHSAVQSHDFKWLKPTQSQYICMVNNKRFDKVQIPTEVNGKTYYGCCSMCKAKLEQSQELREAIDPVSGNTVDKATALIGTGPDGAAYYFESEESMKAFDKSQAMPDSESQSHEEHKH